MTIIRIAMVVIYSILRRRSTESDNKSRILIYGATEKSIALLTRIRHSSHYEVLGFIEKNQNHSQKILSGLPIYSFSDIKELDKIKSDLNLNGIIFSHDSDVRKEKDNLIEFCHDLSLKTFIAPSIDEINQVHPYATSIRNIRIEDLLGRDEIKISMDEIRNSLEGKTVLVTGAAGSIGSELCRQLANLGIGELIMVDNAETPLHNIRLEFEDKYKWVKFRPVICDVRILKRLEYVFTRFKPQIVFHAAAYKHVPLMEENPCEAVHVNVIGSKYVADLCIEHDVEKMIMISTDKAVNPTNIMGCTKRLAEIYVQSLGIAIQNGKKEGKTRFITTRFGNVLGSNGSVIPRFTTQIAAGGPITVTHPEIRRFFMTIPEACRLVMEASTLGSETEIFVFDMGEPVKIVDLAKRMIQLAGYEVGSDIEIKFTGLRPGEKLYEEVLATKENSMKTSHSRIYRAKVREYEFEDALNFTNQLSNLAEEVQIDKMVLLMKRIVPEFKSQCSVFERLDKIIDKENNAQ